MTTSVVDAGISDHTAQLVVAQFKKRNTPINNSFQRQFKKENITALRSMLEDEDWNGVYTAQNIDDAYNSLLTTLTMAMDSACPVVRRNSKKHKKCKTFRDKEALRLKTEYLKCLNKHQLTGLARDKAAAVKAKKEYDVRLKMLRKQSTAEYISNADNKSKAAWQVINSQRCNKTQNTAKMKLKIDGKETSDPHKITQHLNQWFTNIADITLASHSPDPKSTENTPQAQATNSYLTHLPDTSIEEIHNIIKSFKAKTSVGVDGISSKLLKQCSNTLTPPLTYITNMSLRSGKFPTSLKTAKIYPKFKTGSPLETSNYRPISLIPTFSKVIERVVLKRLMNYCEREKLLTASQHGFLKGKSTTSAIIELAEFIIDHLESGELVTSIMLDFSKAFDCLGHNLILNKLVNLGIRGSAFDWFKSYLEGRTQLVEVKHTEKGQIHAIRSNPLPITRGVPQGSVLGPVIFILFTNDLPQNLRGLCHTLMYADDTTLLFSENSPDQLAIRSFSSLNMAYQYCDSNDLVVNTSKTNQLAFGRRRDHVPALPDVEIKQHAKFLGVIIDENLSWTQHIDKLCNRLNTSLYILKQVKAISNTATAKTTYFAVFESHIRYGIAVWGGTSQENLQRVLRLQKRAVRVLNHLGPKDTCRDAFRDLKIMTVISLYIREVILFVDKNNLPRIADQHSYNTRHAANYPLPVHHLALYERKPSYTGKKLYNHLPAEMRTLTGKKLRTSLDSWLTGKPFYTLQEYLNRDI